MTFPDSNWPYFRFFFEKLQVKGFVIKIAIVIIFIAKNDKFWFKNNESGKVGHFLGC